MSRIIDNIGTLHQYFDGVMERAKHHAKNVEKILPELLGNIILYSDPDKPIKVRTYKDEMKNQLWLYIGGRRYNLRYDHKTEEIVFAAGKIEIARFSNKDSHAVAKVFSAIAALWLNDLVSKDHSNG